MSFWQYIFRFLYTRNWHTGNWQISYSRLYWFICFLVVIIVCLLVIVHMQSAIEVNNIDVHTS